MRAVHYLRVSDTKQIVGTSLETQENICNNFSSLQGYSVVDVVRHEGISAIRTKNQRIIELLDYCKKNKGKFDVLVVYKLDRFARSQEQHHWLRSELDKMGIILRSATENISEQGSGKLIEGVLAAVNEYDNEIRRERSKLGMIRRLEQGLWPWNPPVGYYLPKLPNVRLSVSKIDPNCGDEIKDIFSMYSTGNYTFQAISQRITARHVKNISGRVLYISKQQVEKIIANPFYKGILKSSIIDKTYQGKHQRLVDLEVWDKCQEVRNGKGVRSVRKKVNRNFPLRGLVVGECGHPFTAALSRGKTGKRYGYYFCLERDAGNYKISTIHGKFVELLDQIQPPQETINLYFEIFLEELGQITSQTETQQKKVAFELAGLTKEQANLVKMRAREEISAELFRQQNQEYEDQINKLKGLSVQPEIQKVDWDDVCAYGKEFVTNIRGKWESLEEVEDKINYQSSIFPKKLHWDGEDYRTPELLEVLHDMQCLKNDDVTPGGIEPPLQG